MYKCLRSKSCIFTFPKLSLTLSVDCKLLNLLKVDQVQAIVEVLLKRIGFGPDGITNELLKKMP
jgi:hypothetical protein